MKFVCWGEGELSVSKITQDTAHQAESCSYWQSHNLDLTGEAGIIIDVWYAENLGRDNKKGKHETHVDVLQLLQCTSPPQGVAGRVNIRAYPNRSLYS